MHAEGFTHGDLKCDNICVAMRHGDPEVTIIDFGFCSRAGVADDEYNDVGLFADLLDRFFPEGGMTPCLEDWFAQFEDDEEQTMLGLMEAFQEQLDMLQAQGRPLGLHH
ncbi:uncharacterized protein LOC122266679 [Penaeus japonicus]|uniref:uncharacterized protein LOC122266679 n=1 Tax=Penaeus japonicus TaxID=27405 RepID=UPI001C70EB47|nr:uncharacterized protein LOC122266679 [Penaeus japonicus]